MKSIIVIALETTQYYSFYLSKSKSKERSKQTNKQIIGLDKINIEMKIEK